jgi:hypothetical protein
MIEWGILFLLSGQEFAARAPEHVCRQAAMNIPHGGEFMARLPGLGERPGRFLYCVRVVDGKVTNIVKRNGELALIDQGDGQEF